MAEASFSMALFHAPDLTGVWRTDRRSIVSAPSAGHTILHVPQNTQKVAFGRTLPFLSRNNAPGMGQTSRQSVQFVGHFSVLMSSTPWSILRTCIAPSGHLTSHSLQHGLCSFLISTCTVRSFLSEREENSSREICFPSGVSRLTFMRFSGHAFSHSTQSRVHLVVSTSIW